jgi:hypothetical protein
MSVYDPYTDGEPIGMDHPLFMARMQARMDAGMAAEAGVPLADALRTIRERMQDLFGDVPLALIDAMVSAIYAQVSAEQASPEQGLDTSDPSRLRKSMKHHVKRSKTTTARRDALPPDLLAKVEAVEEQLRAKDLTTDELIELCAVGLVAGEGLANDLRLERAQLGRSPGAAKLVDALAACADEGWEMVHVVDTALATLNPRHETLLALQKVLARVTRDSRRANASKAALVKNSNSPKAKAKEFVRDCWVDWRAGRTRYKNATEFANDMLSKQLDVLKSDRVITGWVRDWDRGKN